MKAGKEKERREEKRVKRESQVKRSEKKERREGKREKGHWRRAKREGQVLPAGVKPNLKLVLVS